MKLPQTACRNHDDGGQVVRAAYTTTKARHPGYQLVNRRFAGVELIEVGVTVLEQKRRQSSRRDACRSEHRRRRFPRRRSASTGGKTRALQNGRSQRDRSPTSAEGAGLRDAFNPDLTLAYAVDEVELTIHAPASGGIYFQGAGGSRMARMANVKFAKRPVRGHQNLTKGTRGLGQESSNQHGQGRFQAKES